MGIENLSEDIVYSTLPGEPELGGELDKLCQVVCEKAVSNVVIDFSDVDIVTSPNLSTLLKLRKQLDNNSKRLICCGVSAMTKGIFTITGLDAVFEFVDDKSAALGALEAQGEPVASE
ncbi:MAG: STAS domain-containing protein [Planctomycetota bacterium]|nr:MAG: STAS domain-containing protein [Planctomycetota bacterium]